MSDTCSDGCSDDRSDGVDSHSTPLGESSSTALITALLGLSHRLRALLAQDLGVSDVDLALFEVLSLLRQAGPPYCLSPKELTRLSPVSASAISLRLSRLEGRGLIRRSSGQDGYKGVRVWLTPRGQQLIDETMTVHQALHDRLMEVLTVQEQASLHSMLLTLTAQVIHQQPNADNHGPNRGLAT